MLYFTSLPSKQVCLIFGLRSKVLCNVSGLVPPTFASRHHFEFDLQTAEILSLFWELNEQIHGKSLDMYRVIIGAPKLLTSHLWKNWVRTVIRWSYPRQNLIYAVIFCQLLEEAPSVDSFKGQSLCVMYFEPDMDVAGTLWHCL